MTHYTTTIRTVPCHKGSKGYRAELWFRFKGERYGFEGTLYQRRWAAERDAARMADRIEAYVEIVSAN